jgi:hypothetical protein
VCLVSAVAHTNGPNHKTKLVPGVAGLLQRIRAGKELLEAKRKEEEGAMRRLVEERKREKDEEARARYAQAAALLRRSE